ncbi:SixA phosphatase family protein [Tsukamurella ocularis]|uniref:SixA phosphatase family protein n=1 Tax=Tsukamurella ocularis TaxID=1970234 RepID=UPI00216A686E|nr:histidine phosphatase family protein [Tsukamurella ocularis]MCS3781099.1 phosphohistidine phosphatase [Tsukamurella ocularis]MCS3786923.1 phosphohistidine phosphatase [Tsukamurella ocularis]MCS3850765.1 phosphohistidine phosphatase [Tsukamurella ocularis]
MTVLALMRHGESGMSIPDEARPISANGRDQARRSAAWLAEQGFEPGHALVSSARRTVETFHAMDLRCPMTATEVLYECPGRRVLDEINGVPGDVDVLLVVAHFPGLPEAAAQLDPGAELPGFAPGTIVLLDLDDGPAAPGSGRMLSWFTP